MRQRKLGRKKSRLDRLSSNSDLSQVEQAIWDQQAPDGFCSDPYCRQCDELAIHIERLISQAKTEARSHADAHGGSVDAREQIYNEAFQDAAAYLSGEHRQQLAIIGAQEFERGRVTMQQSVQRVRNDSYQQGYRAGQLANKPPPAAPGWEKQRQEMVDDMLDQCKIIAESNPNMSPGVNAVRHRIKKLKKP